VRHQRQAECAQKPVSTGMFSVDTKVQTDSSTEFGSNPILIFRSHYQP